MAVKPIIFSASMVRALLNGRKVQTRRKLPWQPGEFDRVFQMDDGSWHHSAGGGSHMSPLPVRFAKGDVLYVRETWATVNAECGPGWAYRADGAYIQPEYDGPSQGYGPTFNYDKYPGNYTMWYSDLMAGAPDHKWTPPIHQPRWASRLTLAVSDVRVQRLNDCSEADAVAEGVVRLNEHEWHVPGVEHSNRDFPRLSRSSPVEMYAALWDTINGSGAWLANPWVCAISFTVHRQNVDAYLKATANAR